MHQILATRARGTDAAYLKPSRIRWGFERTKDVPSRALPHDRHPADRHGGQHGGNSLDLAGVRGPLDYLRGKPVDHDLYGVLESKPLKSPREKRRISPPGHLQAFLGNERMGRRLRGFFA